MSILGGASAFGGAWQTPGDRRREMPQPLRVARVLVHVLFAITVFGGAGLLLAASAADALDASMFALVAYGAAPGVIGWVLVRRVRAGGTRVWCGLLAVQVWLLLGGLSSLRDGSLRGLTQMVLPLLILVLLSRGSSRTWFRLDVARRGDDGHRAFSLLRMITWRRDVGQSTVEYAGLIALVAAIVLALVLAGIGGRISDGLRSAVCSVTGSVCPAAGTGGETVEADGDTGHEEPGGSTGGGTGGGTGGTAGAEGTGGAGGWEATEPVPAGWDEPDEEKADAAEDEPGWEEDEQAAGGVDDEEGCFSGFGAFFSCAGDKAGQVGGGLFVDGVWGDVTGIWDTVTDLPGTWDGLKDYGISLGDSWSEGTRDAGAKWGAGDYWDALTDWGGSSVDTGLTVLDDMFIGDEVKNQWSNGQKTRAGTNVVWGIGSLFIPGYGEAKVAQKLGKVGKLGKLGKLGKAAQKAGKAAERARKAAAKGDVDGARKAADEAQRHADDAAAELAAKGCLISSGLISSGPPVAGPPGTGRRQPSYAGGVNAAGGAVVAYRVRGTPVLVPAARKCEGVGQDEIDAAEQALKDAEAARAAAKEAARKAVAKWNKPSWYSALKNPRKGSKDLGDGIWKAKKSVAYWPGTERWMRYQEQVSGVKRGKEYAVKDPRTGRDVDFDGWDSASRTYKEAKFGYGRKVRPDGTLEPAQAAKFVEQAQRQVRAAGGRPVEWHFSNGKVADAAQKAFDDADIDVIVKHTSVEK